MDKLFSDLAKRDKDETLTFEPTCEVSEDDKKYMIKFDMLGVQKDQIKVELDGDELTVRAERREEKKEDSKKRHYSEVYYGTYMRTFTLPKPVDEKSVQAKYENGFCL